MPRSERSSMNWDDARVFLAVARGGSLSAAAESLNAGVATISRRIDRLEQTLGGRLFIRRASGYELSDEGEALIASAEALEAAAIAFQAGAEAAGEVEGHVRLATAENLANRLIIPSLPALRARHPKLVVEVLSHISSVSIERREADLALRMARPSEGALVRRRLGVLGFGLYAAPVYVASRSGGAAAPLGPSDPLVGWPDMLESMPVPGAVARLLKGAAPALVASALAGHLSAARTGLAAALLPHFMALDAGLHRVAPEIRFEQEIWLAIHADLAASRRVRAVADHVVDVILGARRRLSGEETPSGASSD